MMGSERTLRFIWRLFIVVGLICLTVAASVCLLTPKEDFWQELWIISFVFGLLGAVFILLGLIFCFVSTRGRRLAKLRETGEPVNAQIVDIERNRALTVNGASPYRLVCKYEEEGMTYLCRSENIWYNPQAMLRGSTVTIYRDPDNYRKYYVDISEVLDPVIDL